MDAKTVFFLGGKDLEMTTIRHILTRKSISYEDKHLNWNNATLSKYSDLLYKYKGYTIYGVELRNDLQETPHGYQTIDHHNDLSDRPSSLEQVAEIVGHTLNYREKLIAANDKGYIPAMEELDATKEQIAEIRSLDRQAQGVSKADEEEAIKSLPTKQTYGDLIIIHTAAKRFSPITDALYPYKALLVVSAANRCFCYYGYGAFQMHNSSTSNWVTYYGGGCNGFWGGDLNEYVQVTDVDKEVETLINSVKEEYTKLQ